jgi:hypothetical protein
MTIKNEIQTTIGQFIKSFTKILIDFNLSHLFE